MVWFDNKYISDIEKNILKNTEVKKIEYVNEYDDYYLVMDSEYLYLFNSNFEEIYNVKVSLLHNNKNNYELIYRNNTVMYMDNYQSKEGVIFKYYDIYTYDVIDEIVVGDS